ncbi:hypothetical protein V7112_12795 [Bacillus sp. JJ1566]|uniref:hypothetical protein n=1 Tax=Bacillus sp. JJ1566 TaxID=3122961 RepID=UPI002FFD9567
MKKYNFATTIRLINVNRLEWLWNEKTLNSDLIVDTRKLKNDYEEMIQPYSSNLWNYCRYVTG